MINHFSPALSCLTRATRAVRPASINYSHMTSINYSHMASINYSHMTAVLETQALEADFLVTENLLCGFYPLWVGAAAVDGVYRVPKGSLSRRLTQKKKKNKWDGDPRFVCQITTLKKRMFNSDMGTNVMISQVWSKKK
jgi:hypothetical protein